MKMALGAALLGLVLLPLRAEDWTTTDGKTYQNVQVLSHNAAYVTILDEDGGGRIPLSSLPPDLQKRFGYDPAQAPAIIAATQAADQRDKLAVGEEKDRMRTEEAQRMDAISNGIAAALFTPVAEAESVASVSAASSASPSNDEEADAPAIDSEPPTEIDDGGYGDWNYGGYGYGYGGYGYGGYGHGYGRYGGGYRSYRGGSSGSSYSMHGFTHR
jgi:hypothetical protein